MTKDQICKWIEAHLCHTDTFNRALLSVDSHGHVSYDGSLDFSKHGSNENSFTNFPFKFSKINGRFSVAYQEQLTSFENFPSIVNGNLNIRETGIISFIGFNEVVKIIRGNCILECHSIINGGLGLMMIDEVKSINVGIDANCNWSSNFSPLQIISWCYNNKESIYDCQTRLVDAGYEEYAQL